MVFDMGLHGIYLVDSFFSLPQNTPYLFPEITGYEAMAYAVFESREVGTIWSSRSA